MARDVRTGEWIDPFGGRDDLRAGVLRAVHATAFRDDPLRILRGVARCSIDGLQPDAGTRELMTEAAPRIAELSAERVREELERTLAGDGAADAMRLARDVGALDVGDPGVGGVHRRRPALGHAGLHARRAHPPRPGRRRA